MNKLLLTLIVLIIFLVLRFNLKYHDHYEILQVSPSQLTPSILNEKNPIVIYNNSTDTPEGLVDKAMKYMFLYKITQHYNDEKVHHIKSKYALIYSQMLNDIEIINPKYSNADDYQSVSVKLQQGNLIILPMYWRFKSSKPCECIYIHDIFSCFYHTLRLLF